MTAGPLPQPAGRATTIAAASTAVLSCGRGAGRVATPAAPGRRSPCTHRHTQWQALTITGSACCLCAHALGKEKGSGTTSQQGQLQGLCAHMCRAASPASTPSPSKRASACSSAAAASACSAVKMLWSARLRTANPYWARLDSTASGVQLACHMGYGQAHVSPRRGAGDSSNLISSRKIPAHTCPAHTAS